MYIMHNTTLSLMKVKVRGVTSSGGQRSDYSKASTFLAKCYIIFCILRALLPM